MRMFAGPNGSGKSTLNGVINPTLLGIYINPDEIEKQIVQRGDLLSACLILFDVKSIEKHNNLTPYAPCLTWQA